MRFSVVLCALAGVCIAHAAQVFSAEQLYAHAETLSLTAEEREAAYSNEEFWNTLEADLSEAHERANSAVKTHSFLASEEPPVAAPVAAAPAAAAPAAAVAAPAAAAPAGAAAPAAAAPAAANGSIVGGNASVVAANATAAGNGSNSTDSKNSTEGEAKTAASVAVAGVIDDAALAAAIGIVPVEENAKLLDDKIFAEGSPYDFLYAGHVIPRPEKTDSVLARGSKLILKLEKQLKNEGKILMNEVFRAERNGKKAVGDGDFIEVKKLAKQARGLMAKVKKWNFRKKTLFALRASSSQIIDFEAAEHARVAQLKKDYVEENARKAAELHTLATKYVKAKQSAQLNELKAAAFKALHKDLSGLEGPGLDRFILALRDGAYEQFGEKKVEETVKKGGFPSLKKMTGDSMGPIFLNATAHLPTAGPYVRAGLVSTKAANAAFKFVPIW